MNDVKPIKDRVMIDQIAEYLRLQSERNYVLFMMGIYTGLRVSDILELQVRDVRNKESLNVVESKTSKKNTYKLNPNIKKIIANYVENKSDYEYLIASRQGSNKPISRQQAYNILNTAAKIFGLQKISPHSLRKTYGYFIYQNSNKNIDTTMKALNHSDPSQTRRYIGIDHDTAEDAIMKLNFGR